MIDGNIRARDVVNCGCLNHVSLSAIEGPSIGVTFAV